MRRLDRIENKGFKVIVHMNGNGCFAEKNNVKFKGTSITNLHKKIFGY
tara:strand:- start:484 stop:627 length:144 start_codon:yes stop_codon:yes gene_type:complete